MSDPQDFVNNENNNITPITGRKRKAASSKSPAVAKENKNIDKKDKPPRSSLLYEACFRAFTSSLRPTLPVPDFVIRVVELTDGIRTPIKISKNGECRKLLEKQVSRLIMTFARQVALTTGEEYYFFTSKQAKDCADYWMDNCIPIENPPYVKFASEEGLCWNKLPWDCAPGPHPKFDEMFSRMTNRNAVMAWIGSLFFPQSYRQQYLWLYGKGNDGKSSLLNFIARVFGEEGALPQTSAPGGDNHWSACYPGKRFIYVPDLKDFSTLDNVPLKQLTGDAAIYIHPKFRDAYVARLNCKLAISSNHLPPTDCQYSNLRRLLFAEMTSAIDFSPDYDEQLWAEGGAFLHSCIAKYKELCPNHGPIRGDQEIRDQLEAWGSRTEEDYQLWFDQNFIRKEGARLDPNDLTQLLAEGFKDFKAKRACYDWLHREGFKKVRCSGPGRPWFYKDLMLNDRAKSRLTNSRLW